MKRYAFECRRTGVELEAAEREDGLFVCHDDLSLERVRQFHTACNCHAEPEPNIPATSADAHAALGSLVLMLEGARDRARAWAGMDVRHHRLALLIEEVSELAYALQRCSLEKTLDALCDIQYVLDGATLTFGLDGVFHEAFSRVHESNMSKLGPDGKPVVNDAGKVLKGVNYKQVQLRDLVEKKR